MSELGLGFEEERMKKRKKKQQHQQYKLHSTTTNFDKRVCFGSPNSKNLGDRSKVDDEVLGDQEKEDEEILNPVNQSFSLSIQSAAGKDLQEEIDEILEEEELPVPSYHSFHSPTDLEKIWNQRLNSETHRLIINKQWVPRTASLDLNSHNAALLSPQFSVGGITSLKKSPWTPNYQKGWSSERVPLPMNVRQRYLCNGKALPSKWEDAERWIGSPISVDRTGRHMPASYYRRPKSKSGPLGSHSPLVPCFDSGRVVNVAANSPFLAGVLVTDRQCFGNAGGEAGGCGGGRIISDNVESYIVQQSAAVHAWSDLSSQGTAPDEKFDSKGSSIVGSPKVLLKDMATEMSPSGSSHSSPGESSPSLVPPSADPIVELEAHFSKMVVRDVQVDGLVTVSRHPKNHVSSERCLRNIIDWKNKSEEDNASTLESADPSKFLSEYNREEAKIRAWRNLQEAKAETAIRKLEMKLEKERSSSMDKILNKLRSAQRKAEDMRNAVRDGHAHRTRRKHRKAPCLLRSGHMSFLGSCFTCKAS